MHFQGLLCTKKREAKQMPKVSTKNKVIYTLGIVKTQMNLVLFRINADETSKICTYIKMLTARLRIFQRLFLEISIRLVFINQ